MTAKVPFTLSQAEAIAWEVLTMLMPVTARVQIAGSIRREAGTVGDIELVCIPQLGPSLSLLEDGPQMDLLDSFVRNQGAEVLVVRRNAQGRPISMGPKNKYVVHLPSRIPVDIFSTTADNWGMALFVRTGPAEWNQKAMQRFIDLGCRGHAYGGITLADGSELDCPDEETVFRNLQWSYVEPEMRGQG